jgi:OmpA-OmpF porin, OOP family
MNNKILTLIIAGSMAVSLSAFATKGAVYQAPVQEKEKEHGAWYIGAGVNGSSQFSMNNGDFEDEFEQESANLGFDVYVGYDANKYWGVEAGYTYVGNINYQNEDDEFAWEGVEVKQWNAHLVGVGKLPIGDYFSMFFKAGFAYYSNKTEYSDLNDNDFAYDDTSDSMALTYGAGAEIAWENWGVRGEYNVISPANNVRDDFYIADVISANIYYKFM